MVFVLFVLFFIFLFLGKGEIRHFFLWKGEWNHSLIYLWIINNHTFPIKMDNQKPCFSCSFSNNTNFSNNRFSLKNVFHTIILFQWQCFCFYNIYFNSNCVFLRITFSKEKHIFEETKKNKGKIGNCYWYLSQNILHFCHFWFDDSTETLINYM